MVALDASIRKGNRAREAIIFQAITWMLCDMCCRRYAKLIWKQAQGTTSNAEISPALNRGFGQITS